MCPLAKVHVSVMLDHCYLDLIIPPAQNSPPSLFPFPFSTPLHLAMSPPPRRSKKRARADSSSVADRADGSEDSGDKPASPELIVLPNGLELHDRPAGTVQRYNHLVTGAWQAARILLYTFIGFPALWTPGGLVATTDMEPFQHNWVAWLKRLDTMEKHAGPWRECAVYLVRVHRDKLNTTMIEHITKAIIELALRDAEFARVAYRTPGIASHPQAPACLTDERALMGRIRTAAQYRPRVLAIEKHLYRALEAADAALLQRIASNAPDEHHTQKLLDDAGI